HRPPPSPRPDWGIAGRVVVEADDRLVELQQRLEKVGADEAGDTGDQPATRTLPKQLLNFLVPGTRHDRQTVSPARCNAANAAVSPIALRLLAPCSTTADPFVVG